MGLGILAKPPPDLAKQDKNEGIRIFAAVSALPIYGPQYKCKVALPLGDSPSFVRGLMVTYFSYFDSAFLIRGAACFLSLLRHAREPIHLHALALDAECAVNLRRLVEPQLGSSRMTIETLADFEGRYSELQNARDGRPYVEYLFTLTPFLCLDCVKRSEANSINVYIDADTFFFGDPMLALEGLGDHSIGITSHRFAAANEHLGFHYGQFNVGWLAFRNDQNSLECLTDWAAKCLNSCTLDDKAGVFGDQKYLDVWPQQFKGVCVIPYQGLNAAPWNVGGKPVSLRETAIILDDVPLVMFHFHRLKWIGADVYETDYRDYGTISLSLADLVYRPYLQELGTLKHCLENDLALRELPKPPMRDSQSMDWMQVLRKNLRFLLGVYRLFAKRRVIFKKGVPLSPLAGWIELCRHP